MKEIIITQDNAEELIGKLVDNRASKIEKEAISKWRFDNPQNEQYFQSILKINNWYEKFQQDSVNVDKAWNKVQSSIRNSKAQKHEKGFSNYSKVLVSTLIFISMIYLIWNYYPTKDSPKTQFYASSHESRAIKLEDGSQVQLYKNSGLSHISNKARSYNFSGSGKFDVIHKSEEPFTIYMDNVIVKDLGTVFEIGAEPMSDTVFVQVTEGIVHFYTTEDYGIMLKHGEEGIYLKSRDKFFKRSIEEANSFLSSSFRNATLGDIMEHLAYSFRKQVQFENEKLRNCGITVEFEEAPFSIVQEVLEETLNIKMEIQQNILKIKGEECND